MRSIRRTKRSAKSVARNARRTKRRTKRTRRMRGGMPQPTIFASYAGIPASRERPTVVFSKLDPRDPYTPRTSMTLGEAAQEAQNATIPE